MGFKNIFMVGLGLIGGSFAMALRDADEFKIIGFDRDIEVLKEAKNRSVIDEYCEVPSQFLTNCDLVVIALYPKDTVRFIKENMNYFKSGTVIIDMAGIKKEVVSEVQSFLREDIEFLGTHPMAGKEVGGFFNADKSIFLNCKYIITPTSKNKKETIDSISSLIKSMCSAELISISPAEHDEIIAYTSQLPHVIAASIVNSGKLNVDVSKFIGGSFKDMTRVASINGELWQELLISNSENIVIVIEEFEKCVNTLKSAIERQDKDKLLDAFKAATNLRREINQ